jgi:hypothetical protein
MAPTQTPGHDTVVNIQLSRTQFYMFIGTLAVGYLALIGVIYGGMKDDIKEVKSAIEALSASYRDSVSSGIKVQDLIAKSPALEKQITDTAIDVKGLKDSMALLNPLETHDIVVALKPVPQQLLDIKSQLDNMQYQIHQIPGMHK